MMDAIGELGRCVPFHVQFLKENGQNNRLASSPLELVPLLPHLSDGSRISLGWGRQPSGGCHPTILPNFPNNCMKLKGFGPPGGGSRPLRPPLDPPLHLENLVTNDVILGIFSKRTAIK